MKNRCKKIPPDQKLFIKYIIQLDQCVLENRVLVLILLLNSHTNGVRQIILEIAAIGLFAQKAVHNIANKMAIAI